MDGRKFCPLTKILMGCCLGLPTIEFHTPNIWVYICKYIINKKSRNAPSWASEGFRRGWSGAKRRGVVAQSTTSRLARGTRRRARRRSPPRPSGASSLDRPGGCQASPLGGDSESPSEPKDFSHFIYFKLFLFFNPNLNSVRFNSKDRTKS